MTRMAGRRAGLLLLPLLAACGTTVMSAAPAAGPAGAAAPGFASEQAGPGTAAAAAAAAAGLGPSDGLPPAAAGQAPAGAAAAPVQGTTSAASAAGVPARGAAARGRGWDDKRVFIGVSTVDDGKKYVADLGYTLPIGDTRTVVNAVVADVNSRGGVLGRELVPVFRDHAATAMAANTAVEAESDCEYFSSDRTVIAYLDSSMGQTSGIAACMARERIPFLDINSAVADAEDVRRHGPYIVRVRFPEVDRLIPVWIARLQAQGYFAGWDTRAGAPDSAPAKVGLYLEDNPQGERIAAMISRALPRSAGAPARYSYAPPLGQNDASSAVLAFRAAGVTHVLTLPSAAGSWGQFQIAAESQDYRPRYGVTTFDWLNFHTDNGAPALRGSMGVGWLPAWDVQAGERPTPRGAKRCRDALARAGAAPQGDTESYCDAIYALVDGVKVRGGLSADDVRAGLAALGPGFEPAATFRSGLGPRSAALPGTVRDVRFHDDCRCYRYTGPEHDLP